MYNKTIINTFTKQLILEDYKCIKSFIHEFNGDEKSFSKLAQIIDCNKIGIPTKIQEGISAFVENELLSLTYEPNVIFDKYNLDYDTNLLEILFRIEEDWDLFATNKLKPILLEE